MLRTYQVNAEASGKKILKDISLDIHPGKFTAVLGSNGAGKSTLLKVFAGSLQPASGTVWLGKRMLKAVPAKELARKRAVLSQHFHINFPFRAEEVVMLGRLPHETGDKVDQEICKLMMEKTDTLKFAGRTFTSLSGGEQQRVQLARVLTQIWSVSREPKYLLLDEPTSSMDLMQQQQVLELIKSVCGEHIGVLAIVHDLNMASQFADNVLFLKKGKQVAQGHLADVFQKKIIEETFSHPVKMIPCPGNRCPFVIADSCKHPTAAEATNKMQDQSGRQLHFKQNKSIS